MNTIKSSSEISSLVSSGYRVHTSYLTFILGADQIEIEENERHDLRGRAAFIAGKKLGNAVWRNRAKRRMRSLCRDLDGLWGKRDVIFLAKSRLTEVSYSKVLKACQNALKRSEVLGKNEHENDLQGSS